MADEERENSSTPTVPASGVTSAAPEAQPALGTLVTMSDGTRANAMSSINMDWKSGADTRNLTARMPVLKEIVGKGYANGKPRDVTLCAVDGILMEKNTAYDFLLMQAAAKLSKIHLGVKSGFRDNETQKRLYNERVNADGTLTPAGVKNGRAAKPGTSNHQMGRALDLNVIIKKDEYIAGKTDPIFNWLKANAANYGFDHAEGHAVSEPWHWTHLKNEIVGKNAFEQLTDVLVVFGDDEALAAVNAFGQGLKEVSFKDIFDKTSALVRSIQASLTSRGAALAANGVTLARQNYVMENYTASAQSDTPSSSVLPDGFDEDTLRGLAYDFTTGQWTDGRPV